jgi:hypothetical protein
VSCEGPNLDARFNEAAAGTSAAFELRFASYYSIKEERQIIAR